MRLLVLEGAGLAVVDAAVDSVAPVAPAPDQAPDQAAPWLEDLLYGVTSAPAPGHERRILCLRGGGAVTVPAAMHLAQDVELLELSGLLRQQAARVGVLGIVELPDGLILVCDPRQLMARAEQQASP